MKSNKDPLANNTSNEKPAKRRAEQDSDQPKKAGGSKKAQKKQKRDLDYKPGKNAAYVREYQGRQKPKSEQETSFEWKNPNAATHTTTKEGKPLLTGAVLGFKGIQARNGELDEKAKAEIEASFRKNIAEANIPSNVEPTGIVYTNGSPTKALLTPTKTNLYPRVAKIGDTSIFSTDPDLIPYDLQIVITGLPDDTDFYESEEFAAIKKIQEDFKFQKLHITTESLKKVKKEIELAGSRSQNKVMVEEGRSANEGSANDYGQASNLFSVEMVMQWAHLKAYCSAGILGQVVGNLVAAAKNTNTNMRFLESEHTYLAKEYKEGVTWIYESDLIPTTHIGIVITSTLETPHFTLPVPLNAQEPNQPHIANGHYFHSSLKAYISYFKEHEHEFADAVVVDLDDKGQPKTPVQSRPTVQTAITQMEDETFIDDDAPLPTTPLRSKQPEQKRELQDVTNQPKATNKKLFTEVLKDKKEKPKLRTKLFDQSNKDNKENKPPEKKQADTNQKDSKKATVQSKSKGLRQ